MFVHITADMIDIGSVNQLTLQLHCVQPVILRKACLIAQVTFWEIRGPYRVYSGKYAQREAPVESLSYHEELN